MILLSFEALLTFRNYVVRQPVRQIMYTKFVSNNRALFHLW